MGARQGRQRDGQVLDLLVRWPDPQPAAVFLQHVDAGPAVGGIDHQVDGAVRRQHLPQGGQPRRRVGQVVQHARADDLVESAAQLAGPLDRQLVDLQIGKAVFAFERLGVADARRADVDADHVAMPGSAQGMLGRLRGPAAGDQHLQVRAVGCLRPVQVEIGAAPALVLPAPAIAVEVVNRRRIGMLVVEARTASRTASWSIGELSDRSWAHA